MTLSAIRVAMAASARRTLLPPDPMLNPLLFSDVKLLVMNGNGSDGNQDMTDMSSFERPISYLSGILMSDANEKFVGSPVLNFPVGQNDGITTTNIDLDSANFTIEAWIRPHSSPTNDPATIAQIWGSISFRAWRFQLNANGTLLFTKGSNGSTADLTITTTATAAANVWSYVAVQREGDIYTIYVHGVRGAQGVQSTQVDDGNGQAVRIGISSTSAAEYRGLMGPMRITKGEALFIRAPLTIPIPFAPWPVPVLELETANDRLELEATADNILLEDSSGVISLEGTGDALTLEDGTGRLALN